MAIDTTQAATAAAAAGIPGATKATGDATKSELSQKKLAEDLDHFLTLLTTQLQHQDPLEPMDATEFTSQLVQFATVEQQIYANKNLESLIDMQESTQLASIVNYIGMNAEVQGKQVPLSDGTAEFTYDLGKNASKVTITIADSKGKVVHTAGADTTEGKHSYTWDGKDLNGFAVEDGPYNVTVSALGFDGEPMEVEQTVFGKISGLSMEDGATTMFMGDVAVGMDDIISIKDVKKANGV